MIRSGRALFVLLTFLTAFFGIIPSSAFADFQVTLVENRQSISPFSVTVGPGEDPNSINYNGMVGTFRVDLSAVRTTDGGPGIKITRLDLLNTDTHSLDAFTILVSSTGFTPPPTIDRMATSASGRMVWGLANISFTGYADPGNQLATDPNSTPAGTSSPRLSMYGQNDFPNFSGQSSTGFTDPTGTPFALSLVGEFTFGINSELVLTAENSLATAPAPAGLVLVLSAVPVLGAGCWFRRRPQP